MAYYKDYNLTGTGTSKLSAAIALANQLAGVLANEGFTISSVSSTAFSVVVSQYSNPVYGEHLQKVEFTATISETSTATWDLKFKYYNTRGVYVTVTSNASYVSRAISTPDYTSASLRLRVFYLKGGGKLLYFRSYTASSYVVPVYWTTILSYDGAERKKVIGAINLDFAVPFLLGEDDSNYYTSPWYGYIASSATDGYEVFRRVFLNETNLGQDSSHYVEHLYRTGLKGTFNLTNYIAVKSGGGKMYLQMTASTSAVCGTCAFELEDRG